jgi:serine/threonine protein kinase
LPSIYVESGVEEGAAYGFPPGDVVFIVGRAPNSGIVITDPLVSRQHCRIERINGRYRVVDLGSHNGTTLNDQKIPKNTSREISFGDVVRIGESELVLREEAPDDEGELAGRRLGGYQLVKRIGSGGMGEVYRAVQVALSRPVAIKILSPELTEDSSFVDRFMTEARAAGKLNHPNVAQVHEVGESDGIYYYSMEYLAGGSVQERIRGGRALPVVEAVKMALGAARALEYAEKHGVIHCDIKPDNLMLTETDEVRLTDLGIARTVKSMAEKVKQEGGVLGSPHYMAPEQARGEPIDHRVDIYALGATFYRMLAGRTPFTGKNAREIMEKQVYEEPPGLRSLNPEIPQSICRVVTRMMKKKPEKRYQTARELIGDMERLLEELAPQLEEETVSRRHSHTMRRARRRRDRGMFVALALVALVIAVAAVAVWAFSSRQVSESQLKLWLQQAESARGRNNLPEALKFYRRVRDAAPADSSMRRDAAREVDALEKEIRRQEIRAQLESDWKTLGEMKAEAENVKRRKPEAYKKLALAYRDFAAKHPDTQYTKTAQTAAKHFLRQQRQAAAQEVKDFQKRAAKMVAECQFGDLRAEWDLLARRFEGLPAGKTAAKRAEDSGRLASRELAKATAAAEKALKAGKYDEVTKPFERFLKADINELKARAGTLIEEFKEKIRKAKRRQALDAERRKKLAVCDAILEQAVKLAKGYDYVKARAKFVDAQLAYRRDEFEDEVEDAKKLAAQYWEERTLFQKLYDFSSDDGLKNAIVMLGDGRKAKVVSASPRGLTYSRSMDHQQIAAWKDVPLKTVYNLLSRPKLSLDQRVTLARFALKRGLLEEAKKQLDKVLAQDPKRKDELAPLLEEAEKGSSAPAPDPKPEPKPGPKTEPKPKKE